MRSIVILICHDHDRAVAQLPHILVRPAHVEAHDFDQVLKLLVIEDHSGRGISHIHELTLQRKDAISVPPHDLQACHSQGFRRVSLRQNQCTLGTLRSPRQIRILKLINAKQLLLFLPSRTQCSLQLRVLARFNVHNH